MQTKIYFKLEKRQSIASVRLLAALAEVERGASRVHCLASPHAGTRCPRDDACGVSHHRCLRQRSYTDPADRLNERHWNGFVQSVSGAVQMRRRTRPPLAPARRRIPAARCEVAMTQRQSVAKVGVCGRCVARMRRREPAGREAFKSLLRLRFPPRGRLDAEIVAVFSDRVANRLRKSTRKNWRKPCIPFRRRVLFIGLSIGTVQTSDFDVERA